MFESPYEKIVGVPFVCALFIVYQKLRYLRSFLVDNHIARGILKNINATQTTTSAIRNAIIAKAKLRSMESIAHTMFRILTPLCCRTSTIQVRASITSERTIITPILEVVSES